MPKPQLIEARDRYHIFASVTTRWKDNDVYGSIPQPPLPVTDTVVQYTTVHLIGQKLE